MDRKKVLVIEELLTPKGVAELKSFLGLSNYYQSSSNFFSR
ncbi:unnamed protein product [Spirodela intermedia]|uniref:Uncharacterized protein n=2 Tax=Spirodela intermedia TaxID=51605 RepID=A0A7I8JM73_SPIIN|nr:unnamed protein product [Spirodela intermedia]CAA6671200.1 unnamed protein product [Spirodela intermedia]CAA7408308.1 unnamed protein product [Spirodela intermedia]